MSSETERPTEALRHIWQGTPGVMQELDEECNPNKACRNMKEVNFDGFGEEGVAVTEAWRNKLDREGKRTGQSLGAMLNNG